MSLPVEWVLLVIVFIVMAFVVVRRYVRRPAPVPDLSTAEIAVVVDGGHLAVAASLATLHVAGAVTVDGGRLRIAGPAPVGASEMDVAVHGAVAVGHIPQTMPGDVQVRRAVAKVVTMLTGAGLRPAPYRRRFFVELRSLPVVFLVLGLVLNAFALDRRHGWSVDWGAVRWTLGVIVVAMAILAHLTSESVRIRAFLRESRGEAAFLEPGAAPDWAVHGPETAGLAVALFGYDVLRTVSADLHAVCTASMGEPFR